MAFPSPRSDGGGIQAVNSLAWTITYSSPIVSGDLLLLNVSNDGGATVEATAAGFSELRTLPNSTTVRLTTLVKLATGTETGTFTLNVSASEQGVWRIASIQDWWGTIAGGVEASTGATGTATTPSTNMPDPDALSPAWGAEDTYWRALTAADDGRTTVTAFPANYTLNQFADASGGASGSSMGSGARALNAVSDNPGTFTIDRSVAWAAYLVAVRPAVAPPPVLVPVSPPPFRLGGSSAW